MTLLHSRSEAPLSQTVPGPAASASAERKGDTWLDRVAPVVAAALIAAPVLLFAYPPMTDLPLHEANMSLVLHMHDRAMVPPGLYMFNPGHPNQLFHFLSLLLSFISPTQVAVRVVVALSMAGILLGAVRLADYLGASRWTALVVSPLCLGWLMFMGLVANLLGLALLLFFLPTLDRFVRAPTVRGALACTGAGVAIYLGHEAMLFVFMGTLGLFTLLRPFEARTHALRAAPFAALVMVVLAQFEYQKPLFPKTANPSDVTWMPVGLKLIGMPGCLYGAYDLLESRLLFVVIVALMGALFTIRHRRRRGAPVERTALLSTLDRFRFEILGGCLFVLYLTFPLTLNGATLIYERFLPPGLAVFIVAVAPRKGDSAPGAALPRLFKLVAATLPLVSLCMTLPAFADSSRSYADMERLIAHVEPGSSLASIGSPLVNERGFMRQTMSNRALAERGGRLLFSLSESPIAPMLVNKAYDWQEPIARIMPTAFSICPAYDFTRIRYLFLYAPDVHFERTLDEALKPEARNIASSGSWALYESTLATVPLTSPEGTPPRTCRDNLGARIHKAEVASGLVKEEAAKPR